MWQKLKLLQNKKILFIALFTLHIMALEFIVDIKSLLFVVSLFTASIIIFFDFTFKEALFICLMYVFSFEKGIRGWNLIVVGQGREWWMHYYSLYFGLSLRTILIVTLFLSVLPDLIVYFRKKFNLKAVSVFFFLFGFVFLSFISTSISSDYFLSMFGFIRIIQAVLLFFIAIAIMQNKPFAIYVFLSFAMILVFNGYISLLQLFNAGPIGWYLEDAVGYGSKGFFTSDGFESIYRASGLIGHPTFFASFVSMLFPVATGFFIFSIIKRQKLMLVISSISLILGLLALYASFVRSSWFSIIFSLISILVFLIYNNKISDFYLKRIIYIISGVIAFLLLFSKRFWLRVLSSIDFFSQGSGVVRIALIGQAIIMIRKFPFFGVGLNLSPRMMNEQSLLSPELRGFMFPVHNTFILFFAELGIPATLCFIVFIVVILSLSFNYVKKNILFFGIWLGVIGFILNAQVHTLFNQDPSFDLLFLFLGILSLLCLKKGKLL